MLQAKFKQRTKELLKEEYDAFEEALNTQPPVSIRINPHKRTDATYDAVPWCKTGYYLPERPSFTFDPLFHAGTYYVQEAASMFLEQAILEIMKHTGQKAVTALDLCAAPGGKSTHLLTLLPEGSLLVSNEVVRSRSMILAENITKWGLPDNVVTNSDPEAFGRLTHMFDIIVADLPCSGEGMFRKDTASRDEWSVDNVKLCASRQRRIIYDVWDALKPEGWMIYSTCTFNTEENEENVIALANELGAKLIAIPTEKDWNIAGALCHDVPVCRFLPHRTQGEGFFIALMQKGSGNTASSKPKYKHKPTTGIPETVKSLLSEPERFLFATTGSASNAKAKAGIFAIRKAHEEIYHALSEHLRIIYAGIHMGELKGKDFIPSVSLAMSTDINREAFPSVELSFEDAIRYLQREAIAMPEGTQMGNILVTYKNTPLGFVKNIGNRANNLYPQEWRIRSRVKPDSNPEQILTSN